MGVADAVPFAVAAWPLNEASGTRADQVGANDLTDNNTVTQGTGKVNANCADFEVGNSESLSIADNTDLSAGDLLFTIRCWIKLESKDTPMGIVVKTSGGSGEYFLMYRSNIDRFQFQAYGATGFGSGIGVNAENFGSISLDTWYLLHAWHNPTTNEVGISVNAGTADTVSHSAGIFDGAGPFYVGQDGFGGHFDGLIDDVVILKGYVLDATERTEDYNGGTGVAFADWAGGGGSSVLFNQATEQDVALSIGWSKTRNVGLSSEQDLALTAAWSKLLAISQATEQDLALSFTSAAGLALGQASEEDLAQSFTWSKELSISQATEQDLALTATWVKRLAIGQATEQDLAQAFTSAAGLAIGQASEEDLAQSFTWSKDLAIGLAVEEDLAFSIVVWTGTVVPFASVSIPTRTRLVAIPSRRTIIQVEARS
jgi:hypothetical protein